jgi:hypothetical protein
MTNDNAEALHLTSVPRGLDVLTVLIAAEVPPHSATCQQTRHHTLTLTQSHTTELLPISCGTSILLHSHEAAWRSSQRIVVISTDHSSAKNLGQQDLSLTSRPCAGIASATVKPEPRIPKTSREDAKEGGKGGQKNTPV